MEEEKEIEKQIAIGGRKFSRRKVWLTSLGIFFLVYFIGCMAFTGYNNTPENRQKNEEYLACREFYRNDMGYPEYHECN